MFTITEAVLCCVLTGLFSFAGQLAISRKNRREADAEQARRDQRIEDKLDEHNGYAQKFAEVAAATTEIKIQIAEIKTEIKNIKERS